MIPELPKEEWGYKRFGMTMDLNLDHISNLRKRFEDVRGETYSSLDNTDGYLKTLSELVVNENDFHSTDNDVIFKTAAYFLGAQEDVSKLEFIAYLGYYKAVLWAYENGITSGKDATHFQPEETVTRSQFVTFLWRAEGQPEPTVSNPFVDVPNDKFYTKAVLWAYENGITAGKDATHFQPDNGCQRCQVVTFLYRAYVE